VRPAETQELGSPHYHRDNVTVIMSHCYDHPRARRRQARAPHSDHTTIDLPRHLLYPVAMCMKQAGFASFLWPLLAVGAVTDRRTFHESQSSTRSGTDTEI
jgi:hypothetical protein